MNKLFLFENGKWNLHFLDTGDNKTWCDKEITNRSTQVFLYRTEDICDHCLNTMIRKIDFLGKDI